MRLRYTLLIATAVLLVGSLASLAQPAEAQAPTSTISGLVCASDDSGPRPMETSGGSGGGAAPPESKAWCGGNNPLPDATVRLTRPGPLGTSVGGVDQTVKTDANGAFKFENLADASDYTLEAKRARFATVTLKVAVEGDAQQDIAMTGESFQKQGRVVGPKDRPVADAQVSICCEPMESSYMAQPVRTAADGTFTVQVRAGYRSLSVNDAPGYQDLYEYRLIDDAALTLVLTPLPPPDAFIEGTVRDQDGNAVAGIRVDASSYCCPDAYATGDPAPGGTEPAKAESSMSSYPYYGGGSNHTRTDLEGHYRIGIQSGQVSLSVNEEGYASRYETLQVEKGATVQHDIEILKFPAKTAHLTGQVTDGNGNGLQAVSISVRSPLYGVYECSSNGLDQPVYYAEAKPMVADAVMPMPIREQPACAITIDADGRFSGDVTPGYTIIDVYFQHYLTCTTTTDADQSSTQKCGPDYYAWTATMELPAGQDTDLDVALVQRPGPDATVSGYVVDSETQQGIARATIWFNNQDNGAYGQAMTDAEGSFKVRLRAGYHSVTVSVWRDNGSPGGYLTWQGILDVPAGDNDFDVLLTPGQESGGYCCYPYGGGGYATPAMEKQTSAGVDQGGNQASPQMPGAPDPSQESDSQQTASAQDFEDLGGGLGPYDAAKRPKGLQAAAPDAGVSKSSPHLEAVALMATLACLALVLRRRKA